MAEPKTDDETKKLLVFGADGETGGAVVRRAVARGWAVRGSVKTLPPIEDQHPSVDYRAADVLSDDLSSLMEGITHVISALGVSFSVKAAIDPPPLYTEGTTRIIEAMRAGGVERLSVVSAAFVDERPTMPLWFRGTAELALTRILDQMEEMEAILRVSEGISWTAVRPGWLLDREPSDDYVIGEGTLPKGVVRTRIPDLADFLVTAVAEDTYIGKTPTVGRKEGAAADTPLAVFHQLAAA